jgi:hypothetical protein
MFVFQAPIDVPAGEHKLQYAYCLWYSRRSLGKQASVQNYDQNLKLIGRFASVEQFWALYSHLVRPSDLQSHSDFHLFKVGIKPMWEVSFLIIHSPVCFLTTRLMRSPYHVYVSLLNLRTSLFDFIEFAMNILLLDATPMSCFFRIEIH